MIKVVIVMIRKRKKRIEKVDTGDNGLRLVVIGMQMYQPLVVNLKL